jgi:hypothetical protein
MQIHAGTRSFDFDVTSERYELIEGLVAEVLGISPEELRSMTEPFEQRDLPLVPAVQAAGGARVAPRSRYAGSSASLWP